MLNIKIARAYEADEKLNIQTVWGVWSDSIRLFANKRGGQWYIEGRRGLWGGSTRSYAFASKKDLDSFIAEMATSNGIAVSKIYY
jgi:hypothetical protein